MKKSGFTLAEVLITLGIIGVVAAITIPNLMTAYKAHQLRTKFFKSYSTIQQVFKQMEADDVSLDPRTYVGGEDFLNTFKNYVKYVVSCGMWGLSSKGGLCYYASSNNVYITMEGSNKVPHSMFDDGQLVLLDGTNIIFENPSRNSHIWIHIDINGFKNLPNRWGYDLFTFQLLDGELKTMGSQGTMYSANLEKYCSLTDNSNINGITCAHRAKTEPDYFKWVVKNLK